MAGHTIHQYYKLQTQDFTILVQVDPETLNGVELLLDRQGQVLKTARQFDPDIYQDLDADGFTEGSALEFNLYLKGLV